MATQTRTQLQAKRLAGAAGELFKEGKVDEAVEKFSEALEIISSEDVVNEAGIKIKKGILLNRSAALIKIGEDEIVCVQRSFLDIQRMMQNPQSVIQSTTEAHGARGPLNPRRLVAQ